ncbi:MAG TPA: sugar ABC transporter substrate-binding protein, partial [Ktedonobacteraceae bacterium]
MAERNKHDLTAQTNGGKLGRRDFLARSVGLGLSVSSLSAVLAACGSSTASTNGKTSLLYGFYGNPAEISIYQQVGELYMKKNPHVTLNVTYADPQGFFEKLPLLFRSGATPDVFTAAESWVSGLASLGGYEDLTPYLKASNLSDATWLPGALNPGKVKGQILCVPSVVYPKGIAYNKTLFEKYHVPLPHKDWTESDFLHAAQTLTTGQGNSKTWGINNSFGTTSPYDVPTLYGGMIFDYDTGKMTATDPRVVSALQFLRDLMWKYKVMPNAAEAQALQAGFVTGKFAMDIYAGYDMQSWTQQIGNSFEWGIAPYPKEWAGTYQNNNVAISTQSKNKDAAWDFAKFISTDPEAQRLQGSYATPVLSSLASEWQQSLPKEYANLQYQPLIDRMGEMLVAYQGGIYNQVWEVFATQVEAVEDEDAPVQTALENVQQRGEAILA